MRVWGSGFAGWGLGFGVMGLGLRFDIQVFGVYRHGRATREGHCAGGGLSKDGEWSVGLHIWSVGFHIWSKGFSHFLYSKPSDRPP